MKIGLRWGKGGNRVTEWRENEKNKAGKKRNQERGSARGVKFQMIVYRERLLTEDSMFVG